MLYLLLLYFLISCHLLFLFVLWLLEDDEPNRVEFVLIDICGKLTETLHWYDITQDKFALFVISYISMTCIHIYAYMLVCSKCSLWNQYWVWDMLHDIEVVLWLSTSMYAKLDFQMMLLKVLLLSQQVHLMFLGWLLLNIHMIHSLKCCMSQFSHIELIFF